MNIQEVYEKFTPGVPDFCNEVVSSCCFDVSMDEAQRLGRKCATAELFLNEWENEEWWSDDYKPKPVQEHFGEIHTPKGPIKIKKWLCADCADEVAGKWTMYLGTGATDDNGICEECGE